MHGKLLTEHVGFGIPMPPAGPYPSREMYRLILRAIRRVYSIVRYLSFVHLRIRCGFRSCRSTSNLCMVPPISFSAGTSHVPTPDPVAIYAGFFVELSELENLPEMGEPLRL